MPHSRFVLASVSWSGGGPNETTPQQGMCFGWQPPVCRLPLLALINAPVGLSVVESSASIDVDPTDSLSRPSTSRTVDRSQLKDRCQQQQDTQVVSWKKSTSKPGLGNRHVLVEHGQVGDDGSLAVETSAGRRRRVYLARTDAASVRSGTAGDSFEIVDERQTSEDHFRALIHSYLLPNGFPDSVAPQYAPYMFWRGVQYFFGGAMSVFTTQSLLGALGAGKYAGEAAAAINWVIKDGAGRLGRFLFARWGRELDCELKQFRLAGDLLMEAGAALELATIYAPPAFLPLACTANLSKNLAAVAASATRAPIYRTFALSNNLADITAKGESVANLADILGTVAGILLSRLKLPLVPTFCGLSAGYLLASRREVDSVELPYMNRARLAYAARRYLNDGCVPGVPEANHNEPLLPWGRYNQSRLVLGASVEAACAGPADLGYAVGMFQGWGHPYLVTYRLDTKKVYVLLREGATSMDCLHASFFGHVFLHLLDGGNLEAAGLPLPPVFREPVAGCRREAESGAGGGGSQSKGKAREGVCCVGGSSGSGAVGTTAAGSAAAAPAVGASGATQGGGRDGVGRKCPSKARGKQSHEEQGGEQRQGRAAGEEGADGGRGSHGAGGVHLEHEQEAWRRALMRTQTVVAALYPDFTTRAESIGWKLQQTMLNPRENRLMRVTPLEG